MSSVLQSARAAGTPQSFPTSLRPRQPFSAPVMIVALAMLLSTTTACGGDLGSASVPTLDEPCGPEETDCVAGGASCEECEPTAQTCRWYASPSGSPGAAGDEAGVPLTLESASERAQPGDVVCLLPGTYSRTLPFYPTRSGLPDAYIVYRSEGGEARLVWDGPPRGEIEDANMIHFFQEKNYIEVRGLTLDGSERADANIKCDRSHHIRVVGNTLVGAGTAGFATKFCDYNFVSNNHIYHAGYLGGWSSGVSLNSQQWTDDFAGFHSYVIGNVISGSYDSSDNHTDGNGIILDLSNDTYDPSSADTPPVLVANNVVYQNGGRCIVLFVVTNGWVVNNTCYANGLDGQLGGPLELLANRSGDSYWLNNVAYGWNDTGLCLETNDGGGMAYAGNWSFNCTDAVRVDRPLEGEAIRHGDPLLMDPPAMHPSQDGQWTLAIPPWDLGDRLQIRDQSPLVDQGFDPRTVPDLPEDIRDGLAALLESDVRGNPRFQGAAIDIGAYERR